MHLIFRFFLSVVVLVCLQSCSDALLLLGSKLTTKTRSMPMICLPGVDSIIDSVTNEPQVKKLSAREINEHFAREVSANPFRVFFSFFAKVLSIFKPMANRQRREIKKEFLYLVEQEEYRVQRYIEPKTYVGGYSNKEAFVKACIQRANRGFHILEETEQYYASLRKFLTN